MKLTFATRWRNESDAWSVDGPSITADAASSAIQKALERGPIIVEHGFYRGGRAPYRQVFEAWDEFHVYLTQNAWAGDTVDVWSFGQVCRPEARVATGKCPAEDGAVPKAGAY